MTKTHVSWHSSGNRFGNSWVQNHFTPLITICKAMDKVYTNIEQSSRYYVHFFWMWNIVLGLPNCYMLNWQSTQQSIQALVKVLLCLCMELKQIAH